MAAIKHLAERYVILCNKFIAFIFKQTKIKLKDVCILYN